MAKDLMRMLTEITPTQQPTSAVPGTPGFRGMFGQQQAQRLQGSLGSLARGGAPSPQARMGQALAGLDLNKPEDLAKLAKIQQGTGDFAGAAQTAAQIKTIQSQKDAGIGDINAQFYTADSIQDYNRTFQQTGQKDFSLLEEIDPVSSAYKVGQMGDIRTAMAKRSESFSSAANLKGKTDTMRELLDTGLTTGALAGASKSVKSFAQSLFPDVEFKGLKEAEVFNALGSQLALLVRNPASDMGLPGATSNRDLDFLEATVPNLKKSVAGNKLLLEVYDAQYEFKKKIMAEQNRLIKENDGIPPLDLEQKLIEFYTNATVMSEELKAKISGIAEDETRPTYDEKRLAELLGETGDKTPTETKKNVNPRGR